MKKKTVKGLFALLCAAIFTLSGCTLAQPERHAPEEDKFVGFQLVYEKLPPSSEEYEAHPEDYPPEDRSHWVEYGSEQVSVDGFGSVSFPREILIGEYNEETWEFEFPGKEGLNCFLVTLTDPDGGRLYSGCQGLADCHLAVGGDEESLSGTVYFGPALNDDKWNTNDYEYCWTAYRVYQMADGTVYLDGSGNSYGGVGGMGFSETRTSTTTVDGESKSVSLTIEVDVRSVERLRSSRVTWFGADDSPLSRQTVTPAQLGDGLTLTPPEGAVWALVADTDDAGAVTRASYALGTPQGAAHQLVLLDDAGMGRVVYLTLEEAPG